MSESLMGFTLGFVVVLAAVGVWKVYGWAQEQRRMIEQLRVRGAATAALTEDLERLIGGFQREVVEVRSMPRGTADGASDAAIAQLAGRLSKLEKSLAEQDLTILETAEKVAHRLQDRRRKRDQAEVGDDIDDIPTDPNLLLARARAAFPMGSPPTPNDSTQLTLVDEQRSA